MNIAIIGCGGVGQGFLQILADQTPALATTYGLNPHVVAVATRSKGTLYDPDGLNLAHLLTALQNGDLATYPDDEDLQRGLDNETLIRRSNAEVIIELTPTNLDSGQPALNHLRWALVEGKHVITANKGPIALAYTELSNLAEVNHAIIGFEGTVMSGTPAIHLAQDALAGNTIQAAKGIFNGTTNYILTQMENGQPYAEALRQAQELGYAETDPTADVEGYDALSKVLIVANALMGGSLRAKQVERQGISHLTAEDIQTAAAQGERWKLIGSIQRDGADLIASVKPQRIPLDDPLAAVSGATNAITFTTDFLGDVTLVGAGAGQRETGYSILLDLITIHRRLHS